MAGNMIATWAITAAISGAISWISDLANESKRAKEASEGFASSVNENNKQLSDGANKIAELNSEYQTLSKGVNKVGENVNLTSSEYSRYKELISQVSDLMPNLNAHYNAQGEKIGFVKDELKDLNKVYQEYRQSEAIKFLSEGDEDGNTYKDTVDAFNDYYSTPFDDSSSTDKKKKIIDDFINMSQNEIQNKIANSNTDFAVTVGNILGFKNGELFKIDQMDDKEFEQFKKELIEKSKTYENELSNLTNNLKSSLTKVVESNDSFGEMNANKQNNVLNVISGLSPQFLKDNNLTDQLSLNVFISDLIKNINEDKKGLNTALNELFNIDTSKLNPEEIKKKIDSIIQKIAIAMDYDNPNQIKIMFGFESVDENAEDYKKTIDKFKQINNESQNKQIDNFVKDNKVTKEELDQLAEKGLNAQSTISQLKTELNSVRTSSNSNEKIVDFDKAFGSLDTKTQDELTSLAMSGDLTSKKFAELTKDNEELKKSFESTGLSVEEFSDKISSLNIGNLESDVSLYEKTLKKVRAGHTFSGSEISTLIAKNKELAGAVKVTKNGYKLEKDALIALLNASKKEYNVAVSCEMEKTKTKISKVKSRINAIRSEIKALATLLTSESIVEQTDRITRLIHEETTSKAISKKNKELEQQRKELKKLSETLKGLSTKIEEPEDTGSKKKKSSGKKKTKDYFDWIGRLLKKVTDAASVAKQKIEDLFDYNGKVKQIDIAIKAQGTAKDIYESSAKEYKNRADNVTYKSGKKKIKLSKSLKKKVREGSLKKGEKYGEAKLKAINEYKDYYDSYKEELQKAYDAEQEIYDLRMKKLELFIEKEEKALTTLQRSKDKLQSNVSLKEAQGKSITKGDYSAQAKAEGKIIEKNNELISKYRKEQGKLGKSQSDKKRYELLAEKIEECRDNIDEATLSQVEFNARIKDLPIENYKNSIEVLDTYISYLQSIRNLKAAKGESLTAADFTNEIQKNLEGIKKQEGIRDTAQGNYLDAKKNNNQEDMKKYEEEVNNAKTAINNLLISNQELKNSMRDEIYYKPIVEAIDKWEKLRDSIKDVTSIFNDDDWMYDADGKLTEYGEFVVYNTYSSYKATQEEIKKCSEALAKYEEDRINGDLTAEEYEERSQELAERNISLIQEQKDCYETLWNVANKQGQASLDAIFKEIDARVELLEKMKEQNDYANNVENKKKEIKLLEAQIAAMEGVERATEKSKKKRLEDQLKSAKKELTELQFEYQISLITDGLKDFKVELQDTYDENMSRIKSNLDNIESLFGELEESIGKTFDEISISLSNFLSSRGGSEGLVAASNPYTAQAESQRVNNEADRASVVKAKDKESANLAMQAAKLALDDAKAEQARLKKEYNDLSAQITTAQKKAQDAAYAGKPKLEADYLNKAKNLTSQRASVNSNLSKQNKTVDDLQTDYNNALAKYKAFHTGGEINVNNKLNGNEALIKVVDKERVLTQEQNRNWNLMTGHLPELINMSSYMKNIADLTKLPTNSTIHNASEFNFHYDSLINVNGDMVDLNKVTTGIIKKNMDIISSGVAKNFEGQMRILGMKK